MNKNLSVKDIDGEWSGEAITGLMKRCRSAWETPLKDLTDIMVVTFLNQKIATNYMLKEAERRLKGEIRDDSELFDGQLKEAFQKALTIVKPE